MAPGNPNVVDVTSTPLAAIPNASSGSGTSLIPSTVMEVGFPSGTMVLQNCEAAGMGVGHQSVAQTAMGVGNVVDLFHYPHSGEACSLDQSRNPSHFNLDDFLNRD
jgi:hypothetical protein